MHRSRNPASLVIVLAVSGLSISTLAGAAEERPRIGLALSGGGAKGCAHVGVLRVLEELGIPIDYIAGTSMGAVVGGLYAAGVTTGELERLLIELDWDDLLRDAPERPESSFRRKEDDRRYLFDLELGLRRGRIEVPSGLKAGQKLSLMLRAMTLETVGLEDFDQLPIPFRAVATNSANGDKVVLADGDLALAIRASMAIPGVFSPVAIGDLVLVDGGMSDNVPVDVVRAMGADVVIAVDIGSALRSGEELGSFVSYTGQAMSFLTRRNMEPQLADADLVIRPDVDGYATMQFTAATEIIEQGLREAWAQREAIERVAGSAVGVPPRSARVRQAARPKVDFVRVEGNRRVDARAILAQVRARAGSPSTVEDLVQDIGHVYGLGDFESVDFRWVREGDEQGLVLLVREKPWGPNYLRFGLAFDSDLRGDSEFAALVNLTFTRLNVLGGEWRNDAQLGSPRVLMSELYQPLDFGGHWFVAPRIEWRRERRATYEGGRKAAELDLKGVLAGVDLGYQVSEYAEVRLGVLTTAREVDVVTGALDAQLAELAGDVLTIGGAQLRVRFDRLDNVAVPSSGSAAELTLFRAHETLGSDTSYGRVELFARGARTFGSHTVFGAVRGGGPFDGELPLHDELTLGGFGSFSGFDDDELRGQELALARVGYFYRLGRLPLGFGQDLVAGGWIEAGNVWGRGESARVDDLIGTVTLAVGADSPIGPAYLAYGWSAEGRGRIYLTIGRSL